MRAQDPQDDDHSEEAKDVKYHENILNVGQPLCSPSVSDIEYDDHGKDQQSPMPVLGNVIRIIHGDHALNDGAREE